MLNRNLIQSHEELNPVAILQPLRVCAVSLPAVPVLLETLLLLDLEAQEPAVDLRRMSELVLTDLGATLQVFRLAGREYGRANGRPHRIEDCISDLGISACLGAISGRTVPHHNRQKGIAETWAHSREVAQYSKLIADEMPGVNPEEAYLVGLLHSMGSLPSILGWDGWGSTEMSAAEVAAQGFQLAMQWSLPSFVLEFFSEMQSNQQKTWWPEIVRSAHGRATRSTIKCPFELEFRPLLLRSE